LKRIRLIPFIILVPTLLCLLSCNLITTLSDSPAPIAQADTQTPPLPIDIPVTIVQIPANAILIEGEPYLAYQNPGDPFRMVCPDPCPVDPLLISAQYAGFSRAHSAMLQVVGVDILPELQPADIHIANDKKCGDLSNSRALSYAGHDPQGTTFICSFLFEYAQGFNGQPYSPEIASRMDQQTILIHEYLHTIFFGRLTTTGGAYHDLVTPLGLYIGLEWDGDSQLCAYHPQTPPGDYRGYLIEQLCQRNGFSLAGLAESLRQLDQLVQSGNGSIQEGYAQPVAALSQYRQILSAVLGSDTAMTFREACWPAQLFGDNYELPEHCLFTPPSVTPTPISPPTQ
jgi:hypothetical protein